MPEARKDRNQPGYGPGRRQELTDVAEAELTTITGQKAVQTRFAQGHLELKLRKGMPIGVRVTLRDTKMYEFLERLIAGFAVARIRDSR